MAPSKRQTTAVCGPPTYRFQMLAIQVERIDTGGGPNCDANQRTRELAPEFGQTPLIAMRLLEAMRRAARLSCRQGEAGPSIRTQRQRGAPIAEP